MSASRGFSRTVRLGKRLNVEIIVSSSGKMLCEWSPDVPRKLNGKQMRLYRQARDAVIAEMAAATGLNVALMELSKEGRR